MNSQDPVLEYQQRVPAHVGAWVVFCLSMAAAAGFFLIVPSIVVFFVALIVRNTVPPRDTKGQSLATVAIRVSFYSAACGFVFLLFMPSLGRNHVLAPRSTCAANLRGITQSMNVYAADGDWYPVVGASYTSTLAAALPGTPALSDTLLSNKPGGLYASTPIGNVCQSMWLLVIGGQVAPKQFLCTDNSYRRSPAPSMVPGTTDYYANFSNDMAYSYSFAFMWDGTGHIGGWWHSDTDAGLPLIADMAPAHGTGTPKANTLDGTSKAANSFNHNRDGQNVGFGDGHAEFTRLANIGHNSDNIYSANGAGGPSAYGTTPSSSRDPHITGGSKGNWDVVLVPSEDGVSHLRK